MLLLNLILVVFAILMIVGFITQVILPFGNDDPLFPLFRDKTEKEQLEAMEEKLEEAMEVAEIRKRVSDLANKVSTNLKEET